ncbi:hypothetical protein OG252_00455 [Streptomyces sp. NBC_01352]|uniref:hypothetical protein n=1 Tax=unclassified Streptomyces TaxID=2593676 RepID=UPI0022598B63|nr:MULTISPECIES: hypothetical protein [unclassified Streptomyces]MCX4706946.1 hypothetical protein [Streptomyces sp. NBC_01373]
MQALGKRLVGGQGGVGVASVSEVFGCGIVEVIEAEHAPCFGAGVACDVAGWEVLFAADAGFAE